MKDNIGFLKKKTNSNLGNRLKFYSEIKEAINVFENVDYSVITGGFVQNDKKLGDVDILTVLPYITKKTMEYVLTFAAKHVLSQLNNSFHPDFNFPTDVISRQQIIDAGMGRSLEVIDNNLTLKEYSLQEIATNLEADYRIWLYEMITHDFDLLCGSFELLIKDTLMALKTIFLYTANLYQYKKKIFLEQVREDVFTSAGLSYRLGEKQCRYLIIMLEREKFGRIDMEGSLHLNLSKIHEGTERLKQSILDKSVVNARHISNWELLREHVKELEED